MLLDRVLRCCERAKEWEGQYFRNNTKIKQNGGVFKIPIVCFHFFVAKSKPKQMKLSFSGKILPNLQRHMSYSTKKRIVLITDIGGMFLKELRCCVA